MNTLLCSKNAFHVFAEHQGWLLLFDKMTDTKSEVGYLLQTGSCIYAVFMDGVFNGMNDNSNTTLSVDSKEDDGED